MIHFRISNERNVIIMNKHVTMCIDDFTTNLKTMTYAQLKTTCEIAINLYIKFDNETDEPNGINEYFRTQIDIIENYAIYKFNKSVLTEIKK